jgi:hypothetical protein
MDVETAATLPEGSPVIHRNRGIGVWYGVDQWERDTCLVEFPDEGQPLRVTLARVEPA